MDIGLDVRQVTRAPEGVSETLAFIGLGSQSSRAALISAFATAIAYASKYPKHAFTSEGKMKKFSTAPEDTSYGESELTPVPFAVVPVLAFALGYVFF